ncbi:MAG: cobalamin biosynthesis protein CobD [Nitrospinaceae bacterium]|nr:cobalamin biosynthesis protein CobD [Nitrospinaceae bacterium]NIR55235.1 cobalamin biosynthesis protein CobD [Nitrospinaceae bacterium]NIS85669.1 cobalamin biosynthesis protein CobD [Nitrospinaceae bacterium]NIT82514.1 cobalamin biosynthesis protein CobD [Nitrospinaceae bacterium]NIU44719.1 cobalamin biosynthesis protein CobD [Nitrospinaceae bacterium]
MMGCGQLALACVLDLLAGDPRIFPHPVRGMGRTALILEWTTRRWIPFPMAAGAVTTLGLIAITGSCAWGVLWILREIHPLLEMGGSVYLVYTCVSIRGLFDESRPVADYLLAGRLDKARQSLSQIVGRDTDNLNESQILRAAVETVAENTVDGIVAPLFYACLGGPVAALVYKAINTLDSLFGYRNETYEWFGKFPARLDDAANWIPARLGGGVMVLASWICGLKGSGAWLIMLRDGGKHPSPNAGIPEGVMAGSLGVRLGGPSNYKGMRVEKPYIGDHLRDIEIQDIHRCHDTMWVTSLISLLLFEGFYLGMKII